MKIERLTAKRAKIFIRKIQYKRKVRKAIMIKLCELCVYNVTDLVKSLRTLRLNHHQT